MFTVESKSQLAKLMASENLRVVHQKIQTASFDVKNRVLYCPIWKDMSGELYDLLMGHEVGHALYTPSEGWHDALCEKGKNFKGFLNVVEDARIEKKIKRKYPGIKKSFVAAYENLIERDFFGINKRDLNKIPFIDKVNLYTKTEGVIGFEFSETEQKLLDKVFACETWTQVVEVATEIFEYSRDEQQSLLQNSFNELMFDKESDDDFEMEESESGESDESEGDDESKDVGESQDDSDHFDDSDEELEDSYGSDGEDDFEPKCKTDEHFREHETNLLDEQCKDYVYVSIPQPNMENIYSPYDRVHKSLTENFEYYYTKSQRKTFLTDFKNKNDKYISLLAKEFEMKKSAHTYSKSKVSETGDIDVNKIYKYQIEDNIFRKITHVPKGKSHGLILLLDKSGSMRNNLYAAYEQILVLALFCKKVNIPFVVYGFNDSHFARAADFPDQDKVLPGFSQNKLEHDMKVNDVYLREYLNSSMKKSDFNMCLNNIVTMIEALKSKHLMSVPRRAESLGNTPLTEAMIALKPFVKQFKKNNNLDIINTVIVHDGDADPINSFHVEQSNIPGDYNSDRIIPSKQNVYLMDKKEKVQIKVESDKHYYYSFDDGIKNAVFEWYKKTTGSKIVGFFIVGKGQEAKRNFCIRYVNKNRENLSQITGNKDLRNILYREEIVNILYEDLKKNKFVESFNKSYDSFYMIPGEKDLHIEDEELEVTGKVTKNKLKTAFTKLNRKKQTNRVLVSKFITQIS